MPKKQQKETSATSTAVKPNGKTGEYNRTRIAARDGIGTAGGMLSVLDAIVVDHSEAPEIDPNLLIRSISKVQGLVGLGIRAAAEARRNPNFKSQFFLSA
jgi:hypothetical protein